MPTKRAMEDVAGYPVLGQQALDLPGAGAVALVAHRRPDRALARTDRW